METLCFPDLDSSVALACMIAASLGVMNEAITVTDGGDVYVASAYDGRWYRDASRGVILVDLAAHI